MGAWGAGLFSDDTALDVRDEYRARLEGGMDGTTATDKVIALFEAAHDDADEGPPFWLSLAATQSRYGRLEDRVRDKALQIIDRGSDLARFAESPKLMRARARVLGKVRAQLLGPQRKPVKVRRYIPSQCDWSPGEIIGFRRASGDWIALHVQGIGESRQGDRYPILCVLDIPFDRIAEASEDTPVRQVFGIPLSVRSRMTDGVRDIRFGPCPDCFVILGPKKRDAMSERVERTGIKIAPKIELKGDGISPGMPVFVWSRFDGFLDERLA